MDADEAAATALILELHVAGYESEERVILALADIVAGLVLGATLADEDCPRIDELPAEAFYAQPLTV